MKAVAMTKQIFSSHKNPHYYFEKKQNKAKQYILQKPKSFQIA